VLVVVEALDAEGHVLIRADARRLPLLDESVDCVVTSPPYWGLRDYGHDRQIGLERTPYEFVDVMVEVFREVRRVLKPEGTLWLNIGDSYATGAGNVGECPGGGAQGARWKGDIIGGHRGSRGGSDKQPHTGAAVGPLVQPNRMPIEGLKPKDLCMVPARVALALQADGWYLRSDIVWSKPNPMPESVTDRPTKAHEYLFLLAKSERYYYDAAAIAEPVSASMLQQIQQGYEGVGLKDYEGAGVQNPSAVKSRILANAKRSGNKQRKTGEERGRPGSHLGGSIPWEGFTRNKRSVWTVATKPFKGAHFATMPEKLVEPCILAGCPLGGLVLDPFIGSGTVGAVATRLGRRWVGTDLSYQHLSRERTAQRGLTFETMQEAM
jgi:DNA modification methylase